MVDCETVTPNEYAQRIQIHQHTLRADMPISEGGQDSGPGAHGLFDAALAACKTLTATWYAKKNGFPLERVESHVEHDSTHEREGKYTLKVRLVFHGPLSDEQRKRLYAAVGRCPIHKLMTTTDIEIVTEPLDPVPSPT